MMRLSHRSLASWTGLPRKRWTTTASSASWIPKVAEGRRPGCRIRHERYWHSCASSPIGLLPWPSSVNNNNNKHHGHLHTTAWRWAVAEASSSATDAVEDSKRKHFYSVDELQTRTEELVRVVRGVQEESVSQGGSTITVHDCFDALEAWMEVAKTKEHGLVPPRRAKELLEALQDNLSTKTALRPRLSFYEVVLQAYTESGGGRIAAEEATALLRQLIRRHESNHDAKEDVGFPSTKCFNIAMEAWAQSGEADGGFRAEELLRQLLSQPSSDQSALSINEATYPSVLHAWACSGHASAPERTWQLLQEALEAYPALVTTSAFNICIRAQAKSGRGEQAVTKVEELLTTMTHLTQSGRIDCPVTTTTYSAWIEAWSLWARQGGSIEAAARTEAILRQMIQVYVQGDAPDVKPNAICFTNCIAAWTKFANHEGTLEKVEALLEELMALYERSNHEDDFCPDTQTLNTALAVLMSSKDADAVSRGKSLMEKLQPFCEPDLISYNTLLSGMSRKGRSKEALDLLDTLEVKGQNNPALLPDRISYSSALSAIGRDRTNGSAEQADRLLTRMEELSSAPDREVVHPDAICYTIVIDAWSRYEGDALDNVQEASKLLQRMKDRFSLGDPLCKPDAFVYTAFIKNCLNSNQSTTSSEDALKAVLDALNEVESDTFGPPNHVIYDLALKAIDALATDDKKRNQLLRATMKKSTDGGFFSKKAFHICRRRLGMKPFHLRKEWYQNVPTRDRPFLKPRSNHRSQSGG